MIRLLRFAVCAITFTGALTPHLGAGTPNKNSFPTITASGQPLSSVFDGLAPSSQVRDSLVRGIRPSTTPNLSTLTGSQIKQALGVANVATNGCQRGICGDPGTAPDQGIICESGCEANVHNQMNVADPNSGTLEGYQCDICCVDWSFCPLNNSPPPDPCTGSENQCLGSPVLIDTEGEGFHLTSLQAGTTFDISGTGSPVQIAWTDAHFHNAFLTLPGSDGLVHNGKELFGNFTPQPASDHPNGFLALAEYDKPENGGNGDGIIDERDTVYSRLRLWIDENHDGVCQPNELHRLPELGVYSLALDYQESRRTDAFGNQFRYKSRVNPGERQDSRDQRSHGEENEVGRWAYDVFFVTK